MVRASDRAYAVLRGDIVDWSLAPGSALAEVELSERLGISRTPVREALARLVSDGLVEPVGGRGLVVTSVSSSDVVALFELRGALEREAAQLAARRRDVEVFTALRDDLRHSPVLVALGDDGTKEYFDIVRKFDAAIDASVHNAYLQAALDGVRTHAARIRRLSHDNPQRLFDAGNEHLLIVEAIIDGDSQLAGDATNVHLNRSLRWILSSLDRDRTVAGDQFDRRDHLTPHDQSHPQPEEVR
jgi:DNA-binding GntR family transcriptional regulator